MRNTSKIKDLTGQKFNHLTALRIASRNPLYWECRCDCGNAKNVRPSNLVRGQVKSCGCIHHKGNPKHNQCYTRVYRIYAKILRRCFSSDEPCFNNYGGRGITMCDEWKNSFTSFSEWAYSHGYKEGLSIDRIDNNGNYCPENCRWVDPCVQSNNRRINRVFTIGGKTQTLSQWCHDYDIPYSRVHARLHSGWEVEEALSHKYDARIIKRRKEK